MNLQGKKILVGVSGGIAAYKACLLVRLFVKAGADVRVIMTPSAVKFISPVTLAALSRNEVMINMFPPEPDLSAAEKVDTKTWHVNYGLWADLFVIAPATCNTIARAVHGICDNFLLAVLLASRCPVIFAPAMDDDMYKNPVTKKNLELLVSYGYQVIDPVYGELASGLTGEGRMAEPESIFGICCERLQRLSDLKGRRVMITAGPTREYLDKVRFMSNPSTGKMGFELAIAAAERGAEVTLITGPVALKETQGVLRVDVETAAEMFSAVKKRMKRQDLIVMSAAVEDFKPVHTADVKIKKEDAGRFVFEFTKVVDILKYLGENKKGFRLVGFAVETNDEFQNARKKLVKKNLDLIVLNNPNMEGAGFGTETNVVTLIDRKSADSLPKMSKYEVANRILDKYLKMK